MVESPGRRQKFLIARNEEPSIRLHRRKGVGDSTAGARAAEHPASFPPWPPTLLQQLCPPVHLTNHGQRFPDSSPLPLHEIRPFLRDEFPGQPDLPARLDRVHRHVVEVCQLATAGTAGPSRVEVGVGQPGVGDGAEGSAGHEADEAICQLEHRDWSRRGALLLPSPFLLLPLFFLLLVCAFLFRFGVVAGILVLFWDKLLPLNYCISIPIQVSPAHHIRRRALSLCGENDDVSKVAQTGNSLAVVACSQYEQVL